jgi:hypothetical protein
MHKTNFVIMLNDIHAPFFDQNSIVVEHWPWLSADTGHIEGVCRLDDLLDRVQVVASCQSRNGVHCEELTGDLHKWLSCRLPLREISRPALLTILVLSQSNRSTQQGYLAPPVEECVAHHIADGLAELPLGSSRTRLRADEKLPGVLRVHRADQGALRRAYHQPDETDGDQDPDRTLVPPSANSEGFSKLNLVGYECPHLDSVIMVLR